MGERVTQLDLAPTLSELFGLEPFEGRDGTSLLPFLRGEHVRTLDDRDLIFEAAHNAQVAVRRGRWKLIWPLKTVPRLPAQPELYDLEADPDELIDRFDEEPEVVAKLLPAIDRWLARSKLRPDELPSLPEDVLEELKNLGYTGD